MRNAGLCPACAALVRGRLARPARADGGNGVTDLASPCRRRRSRALPESGGPAVEIHAVALLPLPPPRPPAHVTAAERAARVEVYRLQYEEMLARGVLRPLDYHDPRLGLVALEQVRLSAPTGSEEDDDDGR